MFDQEKDGKIYVFIRRMAYSGTVTVEFVDKPLINKRDDAVV